MYKELKINYLKPILSFVLVLLGLNFGFSQTVSYHVNGESKVQLSGTSSLHDWQMDASIENCKIEIINSEQKDVMELKRVEFQLPGISLKSEHKKMDEIAQKALKVKEYSLISFTTKSIQKLSVNNQEIIGSVFGDLEIAGVKKEVELKVSGRQENDSQIIFQFKFPFNMEDFNVEPPSFMFGAVTTGSDIQTEFVLHFNKSKQ